MDGIFSVLDGLKGQKVKWSRSWPMSRATKVSQKVKKFNRSKGPAGQKGQKVKICPKIKRSKGQKVKGTS